MAGPMSGNAATSAGKTRNPGRDLNAALKQLTDYALQLDNPPLLVVCDRERIVIHTAFTGYPDEPREIRIEQLVEPEARQILKWVFTDPEKLRPGEVHRGDHRPGRRPVRQPRQRHAPARAGRAELSPTSSSSACSACSPKTNNCCRPASSPTCSRTPAATPTKPPAASKNYSPPCRKKAATTATTTSPGSTAASSSRSRFRR